MAMTSRQGSTRPWHHSQHGSCLNRNVHLPQHKPSLVPEAGCPERLPASTWALPSLPEEEHGRRSDNPMVARYRAELCGARFGLTWQRDFMHRDMLVALSAPVVRQNS